MDEVEVETKEHFCGNLSGGCGGHRLRSLQYHQGKTVRVTILDEGIRPDNRELDEIRPIWCESSLLPRTHGSGLFKRGQTQVMSAARWRLPVRRRPSTASPSRPPRGTCTTTISLVTRSARRKPPEVRDVVKSVTRARGKSLDSGSASPVEEFPYAIRVVSEVLSSNGSTSMGSTCGSCLALMDAGVPITKTGRGHRDGSD